MSTVDMLRDRLLAVDWNFGIDETREETRERIALFREYLRRSAPYTATWTPGQEPGEAPWPFFDIAARIDPTLRAPETVLHEVANKVPQYPAAQVRTTCLYSLHFAALRDAGRASDRRRDPFAPLIRMYELGGTFGLDRTGGIQIGIATLGFDTPSEWLNKPEPVGLPAFPDLDGQWRE